MSVSAAGVKVGNTGEKALSIGVVLIVVAVLVIIFIIIKKVGGIFGGVGDAIEGGAEALGIKDSAKEKADTKKIADEKNQTTTVTSPWNPAYYKNLSGTVTLMTRASANSIAKSIWDSVGVFSDTPTQGVSAIKQCKTKAQLSWVSEVFYLNYKRDLFAWLTDKYDTESQKDAMVQIIDYAKSLPAK